MSIYKPPKKEVTCPFCGELFDRSDLDKVCSNCFACTGCEMYTCASCGKEIVVKPIGQPRVKGLRAFIPTEGESRKNEG